MRMMTAMLAAVAMAMPALAQETPQSVATPKPKPEKKICRANDLTGSRLGGTKTCHTAAEWAEIDSANASGLRDVRARAGGH